MVRNGIVIKMGCLFLVLVIIAGCKKDIYAPLGYKLKSIDVSIYTYGATIPAKEWFSFSYNSQGQFVGQQAYNFVDSTNSVITYGQNSVTYKITSVNGTPQPYIVYTLNAEGNATNTST